MRQPGWPQQAVNVEREGVLVATVHATEEDPGVQLSSSVLDLGHAVCMVPTMPGRFAVRRARIVLEGDPIAELDGPPGFAPWIHFGLKPSYLRDRAEANGAS